MNQLGKRFTCSVCGSQVLCTKAGEGTVNCCNKPMDAQEAKPLASSD
jgi:desulfoferrodoxin-like iron-binding protein